MVLQVLAHARQVQRHLDAVFAQQTTRTDARELQDMG